MVTRTTGITSRSGIPEVPFGQENPGHRRRHQRPRRTGCRDLRAGPRGAAARAEHDPVQAGEAQRWQAQCGQGPHHSVPVTCPRPGIGARALHLHRPGLELEVAARGQLSRSAGATRQGPRAPQKFIRNESKQNHGPRRCAGLLHARLQGSRQDGDALKLSKTLRTYDRRYKVPAIDGTATKVCGRCNEWFAARPRERVCFGCSPARERVNRTAKAITPGRPDESTNQQVSAYAVEVSERLSRPLDSGRYAKRLVRDCLVGINANRRGAARRRADCAGLALEASARIDYPYVTLTAVPVTPERRCPIGPASANWAGAAHQRAVAEGVQGCICTAKRTAA